MRGAAAAASLLAVLLAAPATACDTAPWSDTGLPDTVTRLAADTGPVAAWYDAPTTRYPHGALGDPVEAGALVVQLHLSPDCITTRMTLPETAVFEDTAPRLADLDGDGSAEIIVVEANARLGARLVVLGVTHDGTGLEERAATPHIGRPNRWLAPLGAADLDGDGTVEIAYIDRPHLARTLRVWRYETGPDGARLTEIASLEGLTNHRFADPTIPGGIRDCGHGPEMITADATWSDVIATRLTPGGRLESEPLGSWTPGALNAALDCP